MGDLDGLKLLDPGALKVADDGTVTNAAEAMSALKQAKPWAFGQISTSTGALPPPAETGKPKRFDEMSAAEQAEWKRSNGLR